MEIMNDKLFFSTDWRKNSIDIDLFTNLFIYLGSINGSRLEKELILKLRLIKNKSNFYEVTNLCNSKLIFEIMFII